MICSTNPGLTQTLCIKYKFFHSVRLLRVQVANNAYERVFKKLSLLAKKTLFLSSEHTHHENEMISIQCLEVGRQKMTFLLKVFSSSPSFIL